LVKNTVLLTFNFKSIDELTGNPPILIDVQEEKLFKDVLLDVIEKLNPLLPEGKKLTLESLGIESFDGEPVSWVNYAKPVVDVIIDFGTSFVVSPKKAARDELLGDVKVADQEILDSGVAEAFDITNEVLKTERSISKQEVERTEVEGQKVSPALELRDTLAGGGLRDAQAGGGKPSSDMPSLPIIIESPESKAEPAESGPAQPAPGYSAPPATYGLARLSETPSPASAEPAPSSMPAIAFAPPTPAPSTDDDRREEKEEKKKDKAPKRPSPKAAPPTRGQELEEAGEDYTTSAAPPTKTQYDKNISVDYFDVMNPENYYPVVVDIADIEQAWKPVEENIITGERKVQVKEKAVFETDTVTVRPVFPGCTVAPMELDANLIKPKELLTFYVTPLVRGMIKGELHFMSKGKLVHVTETPAEVKDPRIARYIMLYGFIASIIPQIGKLLSIDLETTLNSLVERSLLFGMSLTTFIAVAGTGIAAIIGLFYFVSHKPRNAKMQLHLTDFRMTLIPPTIL
jgi:hypothetical protein